MDQAPRHLRAAHGAHPGARARPASGRTRAAEQPSCRGRTASNVSYSGGSSTLWHDLNNDAAAVAAAFVQAFGSGPGSIYNALKGLGFNLQQIEQALASAFTEGATAVIDQLRAAGVDLHAAIQAAISSLGATENQIAAALNDAGWGVDSITSELKTDFGNTGAALYNALASIGAAGSSVINSIGSLFNNGSYNLWVGSAPEVMDVSGGSQSPGGSVIQYTANGGTNQDWFVLPTDSGYAELVNRNSGQCLTNPASTGQVDLVQEPCTGDPTQQWDLGVYQGDSDLRFQSRVMHNRYSGLVAEVTGGSLWRGATVEQYRANGGSNQRWTFLPAA